MKCINCGCDLPEGAKFCSECGSKQPESIICKSCGAELPLNSKFCLFCGAPIINNLGNDDIPINMGDKNIVAGDIIGSKEEYIVHGNATFIKHEDESGKITNCDLCKKPVRQIDIMICNQCKKKVCSQCFDIKLGLCKSCIDKNYSKFRTEVISSLSDGQISPKEYTQLDTLIKQLNLNKEQALQIITEEKNKISKSISSLSKKEMDDVKESLNLLMNKYDINQAIALIKPIYEKHPIEEKVITAYLMIEFENNPEKAFAEASAIKGDVLQAYLTMIQYQILHDNEIEAEKLIRKGKSIWNNSNQLELMSILLNYRKFQLTGSNQYIYLIRNELKNVNSTNKQIIVLFNWFEDICNLVLNNKFDNNVLPFSIRQYRIIKKLTNIKIEDKSISLENLINAGIPEVTLLSPEITIEKPLVIRKPIVIKSSSNINKTIIKCKTSTALVVHAEATISNLKIENDYNNNTLDVENIKKLIEIHSNCTFTNCSIKYGGILINANGNPSFTNCEIGYAKGVGITITANSKPIFLNCEIYNNLWCNIKLKNNANPEFKNCNIHGGNGNQVFSSDNSVGNFDSCNFYDGAEECPAINTVDTSNTTFSNCVIHGNKSSGIWSQGNSNPIFLECKIYGNNKIGIKIDGNSYPSSIDCEIYNNLWSNIKLENNANPEFKNCNVYGGNENQVFCGDNSIGKFISCNFSNGPEGYPAINTKYLSTTVFSKCSIYDNKYIGIYSQDSNNTSFIDCEIYNNLDNVVLKDYADPKFENCNIYGGNENQVRCIDNSLGKFISCDFQNGPEKYSAVHIRDNSKTQFSKCSIHNNKSNGIYTQNNSKPSFIDCEVYNNWWSNIKLKDNTHPEFQKCDIHGGKQNQVLCLKNSQGKFISCDFHDGAKEYPAINTRGNTKTIFSKCSIHNNKCCGIGSQDNSNPSFLACKVYNNLCNIILIDNSNPEFENCNIHGGNGNQTLCRGNSEGKFISCDFHDGHESLTAVNTTENSKTIFSKCSIYNNKYSGICSEDNSNPSFFNCEVYGNLCNIQLKNNSNPKFEKCNIHRGSGNQVCCLENSEGKFISCDFHDGIKGYDAIVNANSTNTTYINCTIKNNHSGICIQDNSTTRLDSCIIEDNIEYAVKAILNASPKLKNCKLINNPLCIIWNTPSELDLSSSKIQGKVKGLGLRRFITLVAYNKTIGPIQKVVEFIRVGNLRYRLSNIIFKKK